MGVAQQRRIFEAFYTTRAHGQGTGLGLSISQRLVTDHGGEIEVSSEEGRGSVFRVVLPTIPDAAPPEPPAPRDRHPEQAVPHQQGCRVLVIDDDRLVVRAISRLLQPVHELTTAATGMAGLALVTENEWDAIITDLMLPDIDGRRVYESIERSRPEVIGRVGFITGGTFTNEADEFIRTVEAPVLYKPFTREQLLNLVDSLAAGAAT
jgi:CheY-like chemotaxis protein